MSEDVNVLPLLLKGSVVMPPHSNIARIFIPGQEQKPIPDRTHCPTCGRAWMEDVNAR